MATIKELLDYGLEQLAGSGNEYAKYERKALLEHVLSVNYMYMIMNGDEKVADDKEALYKSLIEKRCTHYPLQYLLHYVHFMDYAFIVNENVLIPRSDTEILVETVNDLYNDIRTTLSLGSLKLLDLCCGSGCIGISLKLYHKDIELTLSDVSDAALDVAEMNAEKYEIKDYILLQKIGAKKHAALCSDSDGFDFCRSVFPEIDDIIFTNKNKFVRLYFFIFHHFDFIAQVLIFTWKKIRGEKDAC